MQKIVISEAMKNWMIAGISLLFLAQCREGNKKDAPATANAPEPVEQPAPDPYEVARGFAQQTQAALGKTLQAQIGQHGPAEAISFCNVKALPITDSIARVHGVTITRITDRPRNSANRANAREAQVMEMVRFSLSKETPPDWLRLSESGKTYYYFPIITNELCLQCHGAPGQQVTPEVGARLAERYPNDEALGYGPNQLRGLWKVSLNQR